MFLKYFGLFIFVLGAIVSFGAKKIVDKFHLDEKQEASFENELTEEELATYKKQRAVLNVKMLGMFITIPGIVLVLLFFK